MSWWRVEPELPGRAPTGRLLGKRARTSARIIREKTQMPVILASRIMKRIDASQGKCRGNSPRPAFPAEPDETGVSSRFCSSRLA